MKVVLLAGGFGTRISEESHLKPKPMIEIGGMPIIWHIMEHYSSYGFNEFIICCGYKGYMIKEYFHNYFLHQSDVTVDLESGKIDKMHNGVLEKWKVSLIDTGLNTMTGGRVKRIQQYVGNEPFMLTYGDGLSDVNIAELVKFHKRHGKMATLTAVQPEGRFGVLDLSGDTVNAFREKNQSDVDWINGGFMVLEPGIFDLIEGDSTVFEKYPLEQSALNGELMAYKHEGFWLPMDTQRDKNKLEALWDTGKPPWKAR